MKRDSILIRRIPCAAVLGVLLALGGCSSQRAPAGRWEGTYETRDTMIVARLETTADAQVRISAPDALDISSVPMDQRDAIRSRLAEGLAEGWEAVAPRKMDFDGTTFRKPGGVAPQIAWNAKTGAMTLFIYFGTQPALRIPLHRVKEFSGNPWPS